MDTFNYDDRTVGIPYVRIGRIIITYPMDLVSELYCEQFLAVTLADGSTGILGQLPSIRVNLDLNTDISTPVPMVDLHSGESLGADTSLGGVLLQMLAVIRQTQKANNI